MSADDYQATVSKGIRDKEARAAYYRKRHRARVERIARDQARADRSDPFTYSRVKAHLERGIGQLEDYEVDFVPHTYYTPQGEPYVLPVPVNQKRM